MDNFETLSAANEVETAEPQSTQEVTTEENPSEVQGQENNDVTQTKAFSERLNAMTQKAIDAEYERLYGQEYGIHSKADYDNYLKQQEAEEQREAYMNQYGIDPKIIDERVQAFIENHPDVQSAREQSRVLQLNNAAMELSKVAQSLGINADIKSWADVEALPKYEAIKNSIVNNNLDIVTAAKLAYFDDVISGKVQNAQQETIQKITANGQSSPGSLTGGSDGQASSISNMSKSDFASLKERVLRGEIKRI